MRRSPLARRVIQAGTKVSWDQDRDAGLMRRRPPLGRRELARGQFGPSQTLPRPKDFADAMKLVLRDAVAESVACGPDPDAHATQIRAYFDADVDEVYVQQVGPDMDGSFSSWERDVLPQLGER